MKILLPFLLSVAFVLCEQYTSKYDNIDIDEILNSDRLLNNYFRCIMDKGPCAPDAAELKRVLPEALRTGCEKCNEKQEQSTKKIVRYLSNNKQQMWKELTAKYDPDGLYFEKYKDDLDV